MRIKTLEGVVGADEGFLRRIFCILLVAENPIGDIKYRRLMKLNEFAERVLITLRSEFGQAAIICDIHLYLLVQG